MIIYAPSVAGHDCRLGICIDSNQRLENMASAGIRFESVLISLPSGRRQLSTAWGLHRPDNRPATAIHMDDRFAQDVVRHKGTPDSAFVRFNAERLRSTTRRDVGNAIAALFSRCVIMRDTVSIVSPR